MAGRTSMNVSLTPKLTQFVEDRVSTGRYQTASEVVREALRMLEKRDRDDQSGLEALKAKLERGAAQADRGELAEMGQVHEKIRKLKRRRAAMK